MAIPNRPIRGPLPRMQKQITPTEVGLCCEVSEAQVSNIFSGGIDRIAASQGYRSLLLEPELALKPYAAGRESENVN